MDSSASHNRPDATDYAYAWEGVQFRLGPDRLQGVLAFACQAELDAAALFGAGHHNAIYRGNLRFKGRLQLAKWAYIALAHRQKQRGRDRCDTAFDLIITYSGVGQKTISDTWKGFCPDQYSEISDAQGEKVSVLSGPIQSVDYSLR